MDHASVTCKGKNSVVTSSGSRHITDSQSATRTVAQRYDQPRTVGVKRDANNRHDHDNVYWLFRTLGVYPILLCVLDHVCGAGGGAAKSVGL